MSNAAPQSGEQSAHALRTISGHENSIMTMAYLDGQRLITGSYDKTVKVWKVEDGRQEGKEMVHVGRVWRLAVTSDGRRIISSDLDGRITIWDSETHQLIEEWKHTEEMPNISISADDRLVAYNGYRTLVIRELMGGQTKQKIEIGGGVGQHRFSPDGTKLACGRGNDMHIYDVENGQQILTLEGHTIDVNDLLWSSDGTRIYSASWDRTVRCWNSETGEQVGEPWTGHTSGIFSISLSLDGTRLASGSNDWTIRFWDTSQGHPIGHPLQLGNRVLAVSISPWNDIVAAAEENEISLWLTPWWSEAENQSGKTTQPREPSALLESAIGTTPLDLTRYIVKIEDQYSDAGGFGDVFRCRYHSPTGLIEVAVKAFRFRFTLEQEDTASHAVNLKMVRRELGIWKRLDHPNIVPFLGTTTGFGMQGSLALVSAWMPNGSLQSFLGNRGEQLSGGHQLQFLSDIASGLDYLHCFRISPIVHGDLNGNNVLVDENFTARLADFGYSTVVGNIPEALTYLQRSTARPGAIRWSAPELILPDSEEEGKPPERTPKSDIYSFGCLAMQVFSGKQPWSEVWEEGVIAVRMFQGHKPKRPESRAMDDHHWEFIQRCWSSAEDRPTAAMLFSVLQEFLSSCPQVPSLRDMLSSSS